MGRRVLTALALVTAGALAAGGAMGGLAGGGAQPAAVRAAGGAQLAAPAVAGPADRVIWMAAVEYKGGAVAAVEPFPGGPAPGPGIKLVPPQNGRWETEIYRWDPGVIVAYSGETVELNLWGVNGAEHPSEIEGHVPHFEVRRGKLTQLRFQVSRPGLYRIICHAHPPAMTAHLLVLMRP